MINHVTVTRGRLSIATLEEAYQNNCFGYSEPESLRASKETFDKVYDLLLLHVPYNKDLVKVVNFRNAVLTLDPSIPEGEIHFPNGGILETQSKQHTSILRLED